MTMSVDPNDRRQDPARRAPPVSWTTSASPSAIWTRASPCTADLLGLELERIEEVPQENVKVAFLKLDRTGALGHVELLAPLSDEGNIAGFIAKKGPGLHHIAVAANDIETVMERCREAGLRCSTRSRAGAGGKQIAFLHPKSGGGC